MMRTFRGAAGARFPVLGSIVMFHTNACWDVRTPSLTRAVTKLLPSVVGAPEILPVAAESVRPAGSPEIEKLNELPSGSLAVN